MAPRVLIAAGSPVGERLLDGFRANGVEAAWFFTPASRDPTLELPDVALAMGPERLIVVEPQREEPGTLDVIRAAGISTIVWLLRLEPHVPRNMLSRQRWIARAADAVAVTVPRRVPLFRDRRGRPASVVPLPRSPGGGDLAESLALLLALAP